MSGNPLEHSSKFLSLVLRHKPETIGLVLDTQGWANVDELLRKLTEHGHPISPDRLREIVATSDKKRFAFSQDMQRIRASQGHSIAAVDLGLAPKEPPEQLFHGTAQRFIASIRESGLASQSRNHVHLSADPNVAVDVGGRHGKPLVLTVFSGRMAARGHVFYQSANGVWLTENVPVEFIGFEGLLRP
jgi:putative RNA 2'-phosphotransferase